MPEKQLLEKDKQILEKEKRLLDMDLDITTRNLLRATVCLHARGMIELLRTSWLPTAPNSAEC